MITNWDWYWFGVIIGELLLAIAIFYGIGRCIDWVNRKFPLT